MQTAFMPIFPLPRNQKALIKSRARPLLTPHLWCALFVFSCLGIALQAQQAIKRAKKGDQSFEGGLRIDAHLAQSLAQTGCAIHADSNSSIPFADVLSLPPGPYRKVYVTKSGTRHFGIVGDDCDYLAIAAAPTVRMLSSHRMDSGLIYVALITMRGDILVLLEETPGHPPQYAQAKAQNLAAIYADLKSETESWNNALIKLLQNQTQSETKANGSSAR